MTIKKSLENRIRGWIPKEPSVPSQTVSAFNVLKRLELARLAYGVMLSALLITPFGVYHSRVEPYIIGSLWGYNLPIGYIGLILGIQVILFPRTVFARKPSFGVAMVVIGVLLIGSVYLVPRESFINWINGTNFSGSQIDVDFAIGNAITLFMGMFSVVAGLVARISVHSLKRVKMQKRQFDKSRKISLFSANKILHVKNPQVNLRHFFRCASAECRKQSQLQQQVT